MADPEPEIPDTSAMLRRKVDDLEKNAEIDRKERERLSAELAALKAKPKGDDDLFDLDVEII